MCLDFCVYRAAVVEELIISQPPGHERRRPGAVGEAVDVIDAISGE